MNIKTSILAIIAFSSLPVLAANEDISKWNSQNGKVLEAQFVSLKGSIVTMKTKHGITVSFPFSDLSLTDQKRIQSMAPAASPNDEELPYFEELPEERNDFSSDDETAAFGL